MKSVKAKSVTWLIDLDNTLHNASHAIFPAMHINMNAYMATLLGQTGKPADCAAVDATRLLYWEKYGATLLGLIKHHNVNAGEFLQQAHQFDNLPGLLRYESGLKQCLRRLPGRKILFTNAPRHYARQVVKQLGLKKQFDHSISIESMRVHGQLRPKPSRWLLKKIAAEKKLSLRRCVLIEDTKENLRTAKQLGMKTVWITQYVSADSMHRRRFVHAHYIDLKIRSIKQLPAQLSRLSLTK